MQEDIRKLEAERDELLRTWKNPVEEEPLLFRRPGGDLRQSRLNDQPARSSPQRDREWWLKFRDWFGRRPLRRPRSA